MSSGRFIHFQFRILAGVIAAGLTVCAVINSCTLSRILSWMPWTRSVLKPTASDVLALLVPYA